MSAPKFTPGPWKLDGGDPRYVRSVKTKEYIAARQSSNPADSALLAAAPELYEAMERICEAHRRDTPLRAAAMENAYTLARAALAKAAP